MENQHVQTLLECLSQLVPSVDPSLFREGLLKTEVPENTCYFKPNIDLSDYFASSDMVRQVAITRILRNKNLGGLKRQLRSPENWFNTSNSISFLKSLNEDKRLLDSLEKVSENHPYSILGYIEIVDYGEKFSEINTTPFLASPEIDISLLQEFGERNRIYELETKLGILPLRTGWRITYRKRVQIDS